MKIERYNPTEVLVEKIKHNTYKVIKIGGESAWKTNILFNEINSKKIKKISAKITILHLGPALSSYHLMSGVHCISNFSDNKLNLYCDREGSYVHSNNSGKKKKKKKKKSFKNFFFF